MRKFSLMFVVYSLFYFLLVLWSFSLSLGVKGHLLLSDFALRQMVNKTAFQQDAYRPLANRIPLYKMFRGRQYPPLYLRFHSRGEWVPIPWTYPPLDIPTPSRKYSASRRDLVPEIFTSEKDMGPEIPTPLCTDKDLWKHYLPVTSLAGGNDCCT